MEQEKEKTNITVAGEAPVTAETAQPVMQEPPVEQNSYDALEQELKKIFGDEFELSDSLSQELLVHFLRKNKEQTELLTASLERDPRLAQLLSDVINGKRNAHNAMARYFGRSFMSVDTDSPEYDEIVIADEERRQEMMRIAEERKAYEKNLETSIPVIESFCKERGYDASDFLDKVWESVIFPVMSGNYTNEVCLALDHAITYEKDVEDAFAAGDIKGRNTNIMRMKEDFGDGMPKGISSVAPDTTMKRKRNSLIDKALNA